MTQPKLRAAAYTVGHTKLFLAGGILAAAVPSSIEGEAVCTEGCHQLRPARLPSECFSSFRDGSDERMGKGGEGAGGGGGEGTGGGGAAIAPPVLTQKKHFVQLGSRQ